MTYDEKRPRMQPGRKGAGPGLSVDTIPTPRYRPRPDLSQ